MARFQFIHAADLHIDSPLVGLTSKSESFAERVENASRQAFDNMISLAQEEQCSFIVIAGDLFDGEWRDYHTGLFFVDRMRRLKDAGIRVFIVLGNHDAENRFTRRLEFAENACVLSAEKPETVRLEDIGAAIHGRSFPQRDVTENLAATFPRALPGLFNIGLLHTACTGRDGHKLYAPCTADELVNRGYNYWALGHVHKYEIVNSEPPIVFAGNLQGRHARESGPKGVVLVTVDDGDIVTFAHRSLDVIRWSVEELNVRHYTELDLIHNLVRERLEELTDRADDRALAIRLRIFGTTSLHHEIINREVQLSEDFRMIAQTVGDIWIEKLEINTSPAEKTLTDPTIGGRLQSLVDELSRSDDLKEKAAKILNDVRKKTPHRAADEDFYRDVVEQATSRAAGLANAAVTAGEE